MLVLSLKLSSSTWMGTLIPAEELRDVYQIVMHMPYGGVRPRSNAVLFFLSVFSPSSN